jgi:hypothetical protein
MTVRIYRSTDANAPVFYPYVVNSLNQLLQAVLVDGYGDTPGAGWTKAFDNNSGIVVFRNSTTTAGSSGAYFRIDTTGAPKDWSYARCFAYKTMTDINTGTDPTPSTAQMSNGTYFNTWMGGSNSSRVQPWVIIADERTVYVSLVVNSGGWFTGSWTTYWGFGDYESIVPGDTYNYFVWGHTDGSRDDFQGLASYWWENDIFYGLSVGRDTALNPNSSAKVIGPNLGGNNRQSGSQSNMSRPNVYTGAVLTHDALLFDRQG